ncbi:unnamed protein product [Durusdinium trenchii]|uniref:Uncharacterized protein n=2 Tax=Durusdinium trenchii TaxID=1381693 RepID=A0ABP0R4Y3_9DINO
MGKRRLEEPDESDLPLEGQLALLQVDYEVMKVENRELRKRLMKALRAPKPAPLRAKEAPKEKVRQKGVKEKEKMEKERVKEKPKEKAKEKPKENEQTRRGERPIEKEAPKEDEEEDEAEEEAPPGMNAVMLANAQMEVYNQPIPADLPKEKRAALVEEKLKSFMDFFHDSVQVLDLKSDKTILKGKIFGKRYGCVFRESGEDLQGQSTKRFYFDSKSPTYCLDFEAHDSLVTAMAGTPPDGRLGLREARSERLVVLYEEKGGKISRMWLRPDTENLGADPKAGEEELMASEVYQSFAAKLKELKGSDDLGERIFHNYHDVPTVG